MKQTKKKQSEGQNMDLLVKALVAELTVKNNLISEMVGVLTKIALGQQVSPEEAKQKLCLVKPLVNPQ